MDRSQHAVWERIAHSFDRSRTRTWPHVEAFVAGLGGPRSTALAPAASAPPAEDRRLRVLDLMAGNGRHTRTILEAGHEALWCDWSRPAAAIVARRHPGCDAVVADATRLPLADACVDAAIVVAGLHSILAAPARQALLRELRRVLRPGGAAQVTVWSRDAPKFAAMGVPGEPVDVELPWRGDGHDEPRHYHLYTAPALRSELQAAGFTVVREDTANVVSRTVPDNLVAEVRA